jgi:ribosomal protein S18 acetylase RimI-like enzyme
VAASINAADVGHRVVVRRQVGVTAGRPQYSDVLGELRSLTAEVAVVRRRDGSEVRVPTGEIAMAKRVPAAPVRRAAIPAVELERIAAQGWPGTETAELDGWLLRAGGGFTGRANSALPLAGEVDVDTVVRWYAERGLPAVVQVPTPARDDLLAALTDRGWEPLHGAVVLTAAPAGVLAATEARDLPPVEVAGTPDDDWLSLYHYRGGSLLAAALDVLCAGDPEFVTLRLDGRVAAICRTATTEGWLGLTAVEVEPALRRRGLATHLLRQVVERTGAGHVYLQTEHTNTAALALYRQAGFTPHHEYRYLRAPA